MLLFIVKKLLTKFLFFSIGLSVMNTTYKLIVFAVTGDCPALSLITSFINHNGYYSCWHCFIKGESLGNKRQYPYQESSIRTPEEFSKLAAKAQRTNRNVYGHLGRSIVETLVEIPLPTSIILDYMHVTLLGHAKNIILSIYRQMRPAERDHFNNCLKSQRFPRKFSVIFYFSFNSYTYLHQFHFGLDFFNRKMKSIDDFAFVKATEVRNVLFYGLPMHLHSMLPTDKYAHLVLYVCALRLLHSGNILRDETSVVAHHLLSIFHEDHGLFYDGIESFKLHLHSHYASMYENYGSLCNLGCFGQESLIGFISSNYHQICNYGDAITHYFNIDFYIQNRKKEETAVNGPYDQSSIPIIAFAPIKEFHSCVCDCEQLDSCGNIYSRFVIHNIMFHSLLYSRRKNSISYFVQYQSGGNLQDIKFGIIEFFFMLKSNAYALIRCHRLKSKFSDYFKRSAYYHSLKGPIDRFYYVLEKEHYRIDFVPIDCIANHCISAEKDDHLIVSIIWSYDEHD